MMTSDRNDAKRILVVEENVDACDIMVQALGFLGYRSVCVTNAAEALGLVGVQPYVGVFTELVLPGVSGFELLNGIRQTTLNGRTPVVAVSGYHEFRHRALQEGFAAFVPKPIEVTRLRPVLERLVPLTP